jgi:hypothetical protein
LHGFSFCRYYLDSRFGEKSDTGIALTAVWQRFKRAIAKDEKWVKETSNSMIELPMSAQWRTHHAIYSFGIFDSKRAFFRAHFGARLWRMEHLDFRFLPVLGTANPFSSGDFERAEVVKAINLVSLLPQFKSAVPGDVVTGNDAT